MKRINIKVIAIVLAVIMLVAFSYGGFKRTNMYKKYKLASIAIGKGATYVTVESDSVSYLLGNSYMTYYSFDYGIKELSGK